MSTSQAPQIFKATYSGVPVYEMQCKNVAVMRRKADSYLNATQILKVAEFDKPQRTRILEREVQKGQHEKIQGGYGKYQGKCSDNWEFANSLLSTLGTWVPLERGVSLARQYKVEHLLQPILDYTAGDTSPPPAPKHVTAAHSKPRKPREPRKRRKKVPAVEALVSDVEESSQYSDGAESDGSRHVALDTVGTRTPSPLARQATSDDEHGYHRRHSISRNRNSQLLSPSYQRRANRTPQHRQPVKRRKLMETEYSDPEDMDEDDGDEKPSFYAQQLLDYFVSDSADVPEILMNPPDDFDIDVIVDEEGHTSLHWSAAMARIRVVNLLINQGADIFRVNYRGQTALMRAVLFTNNFDTKTFGTLLDLLQKTIFNIDKNDQTVFHHIASTAGWRGKVHASRYYMECLIAKLSSNRRELIAVLDVQDVYGDTALTIAARIANKKLVKLLLDAGASPDIVNEEGKTAQDYITDADQRYRFDGDNGTRLLGSATSDLEQGTTRNLKRNVAAVLGQAINQTKVVPTVTKLFDELSTSYEKDILDKEQDIREAKLMQRSLKRELIEVRSKLHNISSKADLLKDAESKVEQLQSELFNLVELNQKHKLLGLLDQEELKLPSPSPSDGQEDSMMSDQEDLEKTVETMERELAELQTMRQSLVKDISHHRARPANERHQDYKRLIALCCGVEYDSVDVLLNPLLEALDAEDSPRSSL